MFDNAKTFCSSAKDLIKISKSEEMSQYVTNNHITWNCLTKNVGCTNLTSDQLLTFLIEVDAVINAYPLAYVQDDVDGISYTLI